MEDKTLYTMFLLFIVFLGVFWYGYISNIISLFSDGFTATGETIVRALGIIVPPVGAIVGYF
jgi:Co/Zn/Cd efflux system component